MQPSFPIGVYRSDLGRVVEAVFETMLGLAVEPVETPWTAAPDRVTAAVYFVGLWNGAIVLECSPSQACSFTQLLLSGERPTVINDDVRDALGELANMLAGNLKSVLPRGAGLSVPSITVGTDYTVRVCGGNTVERLGYKAPDGVFWITLVEIQTSETRG